LAAVVSEKELFWSLRILRHTKIGWKKRLAKTYQLDLRRLSTNFTGTTN